MDVVDGLQLLHAVTGQLLFVALDGIKAYRIEVVDGSSQAMRCHIVGSARLELERQALEGGLLPRDFVYHLATTLIRRQLLQPLLLAVEHANACRTVHLMTAERKEVAVHRLDIDLEVRSTLRTIYQNGDAVLMSGLDDLFDGGCRVDERS